MEPKPTHLGPEYGAVFCDQAVAEAYRFRPPYPPAIVPALLRLITQPRVVLDAGAGTGALGRAIAPHVSRVDAIEPSAAMVEAGRVLPGGDRLRWIEATIEAAQLDGPYGLAVSGSSIHWFEWEVALPKIAEALAPGALLAIVEDVRLQTPWEVRLRQLLRHYSTNPGERPVDVVEELRRRQLFTPLGAPEIAPAAIRQSVADYVESFHSRSGFSRERMTPEDAAAFDDALRRAVAPYVVDGMLEIRTAARLVWGTIETRPEP